MIHKYTINAQTFSTFKYPATIYLETQDLITFFPADDDAGTPARLEIGGHTALEFEGEVTFEKEK